MSAIDRAADRKPSRKRTVMNVIMLMQMAQQL
jgi:hypothetical protein